MEPTPDWLNRDVVEKARRDLHDRTLAKLDGDLARLVYLASTRDYNTGCYMHDGLVFHFTESVATWVLAAAHREVFISLALSPMKVLVGQLKQYIRSGCARPEDLVATWGQSEAYRILAPARVDALMVKLFNSNVRVALAIVGSSWTEQHPRPDPQYASQRPLPGR
jgi:hypothetical protein